MGRVGSSQSVKSQVMGHKTRVKSHITSHKSSHGSSQVMKVMKCTMYQRKVDVDMLSAIKSVG